MSKSYRLIPLDALRGLIMIVMALDHATLFIARAHPRPEFWYGFFPAYDEPLAFLTRFVTHLAAPGFAFLMGAGIALFQEARQKAGWSRWQILRHLVIRGALLIALQLFVENPAWQIDMVLRGRYNFFTSPYIGVLYGLGSSMILAALLLPLNSTWLTLVSLSALLAPEIIMPFITGAPSPLISFTLLPLLGRDFTVYYPTLPWFGLVGFGLVFGRWLIQDRTQAFRRGLIAGTLLLAAFFIVRFLNGFGNIRPPQTNDWIGFFNVVKYPPSLVFILFTMGVNLLLLFAMTRIEKWIQPLLVFGQNPLFFYLIHLYLYGLIGFYFFPQGAGLARMYPIWLLGLGVLWGACGLYGKFKETRSPNSLWRFL